MTKPGEFDHITRLPASVVTDLGKKAANDVSAALFRTVDLAGHPRDKLEIAMMAASVALGMTSGFSRAILPDKVTAEEAADGLWALMRPIMVHATGGDSTEFKAMLQRARPASERS